MAWYSLAELWIMCLFLFSCYTCICICCVTINDIELNWINCTLGLGTDQVEHHTHWPQPQRFSVYVRFPSWCGDDYWVSLLPLPLKELQVGVTPPENKNSQFLTILGTPGVGVTETISSVPLFSKFFSIVKTHVRYWISHLYLTGVATAELWLHLSNMNVIQRI